MSTDETARVPVVRSGGRHRRPDDDDDVSAVEDATIAAPAVWSDGRGPGDEHDRWISSLSVDDTAVTGRHHFAGLADVALADDHRAAPSDSGVVAPMSGERTPEASAGGEASPEARAERLPPLAVPSEPRRSRAGRNLPAAIGVGVGIGAVIVASLLIQRQVFVFVLGAAVLYGIWELAAAIGTVEARPPIVPLLVGAVAMEASAWFRGPNGLVVALLVTVCGVLVWRLADGAAGYQRDVASAVLALLYLPLLAGFAVLLTHPSDGAARVLLFLGTVVCSDTGGYAAGVLFGKHPLAPVVSKGKTWEGLVGSVLVSGLCGALVLSLAFHHPWWQGVAFGAAIAVTATLGDLGESMIKRDLGLKDMGRLLPGHGGVMDRLDSLLPCAVVAYLLVSAFLDH